MRRGVHIGLYVLLLFLSLGAVIFVLIRKPAHPKSPHKNESQHGNTAVAAVKEKVKIEKPKPLEFTFGGRELFPHHRLIALYGNPNFKMLGSLGEQELHESVQRVKNLAAQYQPFSDETIIPAFEIIATVASAQPTENNDYSQELDTETIQPWVEVAEKEGLYIVLDLQPGRTPFDEQIKRYEGLLMRPNIGIALDPEWRLLTPESRHLKKIGSVGSEEINRTSEWLAELVKKHDLPQKLFMIHQFKLSMIEQRETLITNRQGLAFMIHMDGHGELGSKVNTWNTIKESLPENIRLGWKNFIDEDKPTPTPEQTMTQDPKPWFVSYQ